MAEPSTFEKVQRSDVPLFGPRKLLLCGFGPQAQSKFKTVLDMAAIADLALVWATDQDGAASLAELFERADQSGESRDSDLPRAIIMAGITQNELLRLMGTCKQVGMQSALWATLTPVSATWSLSALLAELAAEREALARRR